MRVRFTHGARRQLAEILAYIAQEDPVAADRVLRRIEDVAEKLGGNPGLGRKVSRKGVRMFPATPYPYLIFYEVTDALEIVRVRHAARRSLFLNEPAVEFSS